MPEHCTCGTQLVENARFCHRCGRPAFDEPTVETPVAAPELPQLTLQEKIAQLPVNFGNPIALRVAFLMSLGIIMVSVVPDLIKLFPVWGVVAGWCGVLLYRRLTGRQLTVPAGAKLGSITGILTFLSFVIIMGITVFFTGRQMFDQMVAQDPRMSEVVNSPAMLATVFLMVLGAMFALVVGFCAAGGALGARFSTRKTA